MTQAIGLLLDIFGLAAITALVATLMVAFGGARLSGFGRIRDLVVPCAVVVGFFAGYLLLPPSFVALVPQENRPWQWLPYFVAIAAILSASLSPRSLPVAGLFPLIVSGCIGASVFAPDWPVFGLGRPLVRLLVALYLLLVGAPLLYLPSKPRERWLPLAFAISAAINALAIGAIVSLRLAQLSAITAGCFAAAAIGNLSFIRVSDLSIRSLITIFAISTGGTAWLAFIEPDPPRPELLIVPMFPLLLWLPFASGAPFARDRIG